MIVESAERGRGGRNKLIVLPFEFYRGIDRELHTFISRVCGCVGLDLLRDKTGFGSLFISEGSGQLTARGGRRDHTSRSSWQLLLK